MKVNLFHILFGLSLGDLIKTDWLVPSDLFETQSVEDEFIFLQSDSERTLEESG